MVINNNSDVIELYHQALLEQDTKDEFFDVLSHYETHWDIEAEDFKQMFITAITKAKNVFSSRIIAVNSMIKLIDKDAEYVRNMFRVLYDEDIELDLRILNFRKMADELDMRGERRNFINHNQYLNVISVYLWLKYPNKYYIFRVTEYREMVKILNISKTKESFTKLEEFLFCYELYDSIYDILYYRDVIQDNINKDNKIGMEINLRIFIILMSYISKKITTAYKKSLEENNTLDNDTSISGNKEYYRELSKNVYTIKDLENDVYGIDDVAELISLIKRNKSIILQGPPGVGKTFAAKRIAYAIMKEKDDSRIRMVQFHASYSYEDFIVGLRPSKTGNDYELVGGIFYNLCKIALSNPDKEYFCIIDEINRGSILDIFGELFMLMEGDYREDTVVLKNNISFQVPNNIYIIGTMNTADRGIIPMNKALKGRRFKVCTMRPRFDSVGFKAYEKNLNSTKFKRIIDEIIKLNKVIASDISLGKGNCIGHSYFCYGDDYDDTMLKETIKYAIIPVLEDYWYDNQEEVDKWDSIFRGILND